MYDVVVVGSGPVGLFLACELRLAGARPLVLERLTEPVITDKAHGLTGQVVRLLDHRGLFERCGGRGSPTPAPGFFFGALPLPLRVLGDDNPMYLLPCYQRKFETILTEQAAELGVEIRRGCEVRSFAQDAAQVDVEVRDQAGTSTISARYLVGCDGAHSVVRKQMGVAFPGITDDHIVSRSAIIAPSDTFRFTAAGRLVVAGLGEISPQFHRTERGVFTLAPFDPQRPHLTTTEWEDEPAGDSPGAGAPMTMTEMEDSVERILGVRPSLAPASGDEPGLLRRLSGCNTRIAERYRAGRVFLAGDAAHVHSASGGPGLNLGLQDAANLAWKLAADVQGWASPGLLDTYESERLAIGRRVFMQTQAQTALMAPGGPTTALRELFGEMLDRVENVQLVADLMAGSDVRLDMGDEDPAGPTGRFVPNLDLRTTDGRPHRIAEFQRDGRAVLLDLIDGGELAAATSPWTDRVKYVRAAAATTDAPAALLIRPDGYVAWAGIDPDGLRSALARWFGPAELPASRATDLVGT
jgi:2-polyprenyl-6-methoxyphenol hydroxylase-like FAD-dependent oxidoreductase